ncbi:peptide chain release factor N(5)-glutamine methyltransferase [Frigidibacter sp. RF13]|uniref:peptide chain release factor N(5)-glutamine methyltransferase n=1 Tax=Frigidibacter sp. RF13 TaxID=2997340 RepID=UPI00226F5B49|nr:peptide chain release factor N(5)-glutamine methyltransferase [Frigidibacter sp. RF13]MCY1127961.1 peptide chain release factor N(5)-glutamine methyltransferase [Frigidibacter sp. RF13]
MTGNEALRAAIPRLRTAGIDSAPGDARRLLAHALGLSPDRLILHLADEMTGAQQRSYEEALAQRVRRRPVSQIVGERQFLGRTFRVTGDVLDPRPETELLVLKALERPFVRMLDLGTGSGCILLSCLAGMPMATGLGTDLSEAALDVARDNATRLGLAARATFARSDWYQAVAGRFDLIVSNPPYIAADEMAGLAPEVRDWEPHLALTPGGDGLDAYRAIAAGAGARLMAGGRILLEIGPAQGQAVAALLDAQGFESPAILPDLDGRDRIVMAVKPGDPEGCGAV